MKTNYRSRYFLIVTIPIFFAGGSVLAGSGTWLASPASGNWNNAPNWSPMTVPNGPSDTATFGSSSVTHISISEETEVNGIVFNPGAPAFTITASPEVVLTVSGAGITNDSGVTQSFVSGSEKFQSSTGIVFNNNATAGNMTVFTNIGDMSGNPSVGFTSFNDSSTAGSATINNNASTINSTIGGITAFNDNSSAGRATINIYGATGMSGAGGLLRFTDTASAGNATITVYGATIPEGAESTSEGQIAFNDSSSADNATLIAHGGLGEGAGGLIFFGANSSGGKARVELLGNAQLLIGAPEGTMVGSLEGTGHVLLEFDGPNLTVGSNNLSTVFSGVIRDFAVFDLPPGSLTKIGTGTLVLSGASTYAGGTTVNGGVLQVDNTSGSGTGTGPVAVNSGGKLSGTGIIAGNINNNGVVSPGDSPGTLHVGGNFSQGSGGTLEIEIASLFSFDQLMVAGTATLSGTLDVSLDGYTGHAGDMFTILTSSGLSGNFLTFDLPELSNGLFFTESITSNDVLLTVNSSTGVPDSGSTLLLMAGALGALLGMRRCMISHAKPIQSPCRYL